ncbi:uncharacterized protein FIBRA_03371 [Fibroporia radiculosa]|uniref:Histone acetyltransferase n=1 Tax=Fibroporia radiculosa TaxID=599839 RepID=J4HVY5_9APHY|nr:uncharacterized protein FIBRA_03371 [Fibroporia radiculosa]CCM01322.1 predicted protein [Fibroporia radiculosa]
MARGPASPPPTPLPKVSFMKVQDEFSSYPMGVHDAQAKTYGYNELTDFKRPEHYIRYIGMVDFMLLLQAVALRTSEPLESDLATQVEYDMDEQDHEWLNTVNVERKKLQQDGVSYEVFEIVMDRLEKEWFDLTKNIPKPDLALPSEDSTCAICDDSEGENTNAIVFCDGCNLAVHQDCYGVPYIPEGQWLCRKCTVSPENPVSCILCPNEGGAFKQTVHGDWVHLLCAIWVPETRVANDVFMEPITGIDKISKQRWRLKEQQDTRAAALVAESNDQPEDDSTSPKSSKTARAYAKTYKPGPPLVPHIIVERILQYIGKVNIRHKREFVILVCKYWSLKREARRGAAFLKRLHLEPWTASSTTRQQTDEEKAIKLEFMRRLRRDLESIRMVTEMCRKREALKLERAESRQFVFDKTLLTHEPPLRMAFEKIIGADRQEYFKNPVSKLDVPDYYDIVKQPMCWSIIDRKLDRHEYLDLHEFKDDVNLVINNAIIYNKPGTPYYKTAQKIQSSAEPIMAELDRLVNHRFPVQGSSDQEQPQYSTGGLEPPLHLLQLLLSEDSVKEDLALILDKSPLEALFSYELPRIRPPPPPKPKRNRKADLERKRQQRLESAAEFRTRTRRGAATFAQFEAEIQETTETPALTPVPEAGPSNELEVSQVARPGKPGRKKRMSGPGFAHANLPPMVETVDNQQSFKLFERGWVLPPDQRRGNRPRPSFPTAPPKKKLKIGERGKYHMFSFTSPGDEHETSQAQLPSESNVGPEEDMMELDEVPIASAKDQPAENYTATIAEQSVEHPISHAAGPATDPSIATAEQVTDHHPSPTTEQSSEQRIGVAARQLIAHPDALVVQKLIDQPTSRPEIQQSARLPAAVELPTAILAGHVVAEQTTLLSAASGTTNPFEPPAVLSTTSFEDVTPLADRLTEHPVAPVVNQSIQEKRELSAGPTAGPSSMQSASSAMEPAAVAMEVDRPIRKPKPVRIARIVIEELDTPAIRREKNLRRKAEKARLAALAAAAATASRGSSSIGPDATMETGKDYEMSSDLSSLSDLSDDGEGTMDGQVSSRTPDASSQHPRIPMTSATAEPGAVVLEPGRTLEGGTLVWAKAATFPWWPAVVFEPDDHTIPPNMLPVHHRGDTRGPIHLVRFYDSKRSWQWVTLNKMKMLGEDDDLDAELLANSSKLQKWKTPKLRKQCRDAFREALAEMEDAGVDEEHDPISES